MKKISPRPSPLTVLALSLTALVAPLHAVSVRVSLTVDNSYALFYGTATQATTFVGSNFNWTDTETYNFNLPSNNYIYVVTASDVAVAQGFLGQFENLDEGYKFYSNSPQWQVMATGLGNAAPYTGSASDLALLSAEIQDANGGGNPSGGWVGLTEGPVNGGGPWGLRPGIDAAAHWTWYSSNGDPDPTTPGFNHSEWLAFRVALAATPNVPVPDPNPRPTPDGGTTVGLLAISLIGLHQAVRLKRRSLSHSS